MRLLFIFFLVSPLQNTSAHLISAQSQRSTKPLVSAQSQRTEVTATESEQGHTQINDRISLTNDSLVSKPYSNSFLQKIYITVTTIHTASPNERPPVLVSHRYNINSLTVLFVYAIESFATVDFGSPLAPFGSPLAQSLHLLDNSDTRFNPHRKNNTKISDSISNTLYDPSRTRPTS